MPPKKKFRLSQKKEKPKKRETERKDPTTLETKMPKMTIQPAAIVQRSLNPQTSQSEIERKKNQTSPIL